MVDYIRSIVSGKKRRFVDMKYNLDLSYITPRIIAMAFPASGIGTLYRNNINEVADFLFSRHGKNFLVFNLSENKYDSSKFYDQVLEFDWLDHHAPKLEILFNIVSKMNSFAKENITNTIVVHCNAGKGRTGTMICCYMLFTGIFESVEECMKYYSKQRFEEGDAVTQPGQVRYINYFFKMLKEKVYFPLKKTLKSVQIIEVPLKDKVGEIKPYIEVYLDNSDTILFHNRLSYFDQPKFNYTEGAQITASPSNFNLEVIGDLTIKIFCQFLMSNKLIGMVSFNTAFSLPSDKKIEFEKHEIDPDSLMKKSYISPNYKIIVEIDSECQCDNRSLPIRLCDDCKEKLKLEIKGWRIIHNIIEVSFYS